MVFVVRCPSCKRVMRYNPVKSSIVNARKVCVFCGRSFKVHSSILDSNIVSSSDSGRGPLFSSASELERFKDFFSSSDDD